VVYFKLVFQNLPGETEDITAGGIRVEILAGGLPGISAVVLNILAVMFDI
jgi:hypothetical protein